MKMDAIEPRTTEQLLQLKNAICSEILHHPYSADAKSVNLKGRRNLRRDLARVLTSLSLRTNNEE